MTDSRKIKIFLRWVYFWEEVVSERRGELLKATCIMSAREEKMDVTLAYLFLSPIPLSTFCSSREYSYPGEKTSSYLAKKTVLFFSSPSWQTREFRVYGPSEEGAQCTLCIVDVSKICTVVSYIKTDVGLSRARDRSCLTLLKVHWCQPVSQIQDRFPCFLRLSVKSYSSQQLCYRVNFSTSCRSFYADNDSIFLMQFLAYFILPFRFITLNIERSSVFQYKLRELRESIPFLVILIK